MTKFGMRNTQKALALQWEASIRGVDSNYHGLKLATLAIAQANFDIKAKAVKFVQGVGFHMSREDIEGWFRRMS